jgi:gas vesicle protein
MKTNKGLLIGLSIAGAAVAGVVVYLTTTESGKKAVKKWRARNKKISEKAQEIIRDAGRKFKHLKEELADEYKSDDVVVQAYE